MGDEMFDFLKDTVASAPDLAAEDESSKPKRRRLVHAWIGVHFIRCFKLKIWCCAPQEDING